MLSLTLYKLMGVHFISIGLLINNNNLTFIINFYANIYFLDTACIIVNYKKNQHYFLFTIKAVLLNVKIKL